MGANQHTGGLVEQAEYDKLSEEFWTKYNISERSHDLFLPHRLQFGVTLVLILCYNPSGIVTEAGNNP